MSHLVRKYRLRKSGGQRTECDFFFFLRLGFNEPTEKSEATMEIENLRKSSVTKGKNYLMQERGLKQ